MEVTVNQLIEFLQGEVELNEELGERAIHVQHQESYPLILEIDGFYDPQGEEAKGLWMGEALEEAAVDGIDVEPSSLESAWEEVVEEDAQRKPVYLVLGSHPYGLNPYGSKEAWELKEHIR